MFSSAVFLVGCLLVNGIPVGIPVQADSSPQLFTLMLLVQDKKYPEAIAGYESFLKQAPKTLQGAVEFEIAALHAAMGNKDRALAMIEQAIQSGFDDCPALQQREELQSIRSDPRFRELHSRVRVSEADLKEIFWLKAEIESVRHDTKMMITENMNRVDSGITVVTQSAIPIRATTSPAVLYYRELLKDTLRSQRSYVFEADKLRMQHLTRMTIISGGASSAQAARSLQFAESAAAARKRAIEARKFSLPPGAATTPRPCADWK